MLRGDAPCGDAVDTVAGLPMSADGGTFLGTELYVHSMQNDTPKHTVYIYMCVHMYSTCIYIYIYISYYIIICSMFLFSDSFQSVIDPWATQVDHFRLQLKDLTKHKMFAFTSSLDLDGAHFAPNHVQNGIYYDSNQMCNEQNGNNHAYWITRRTRTKWQPSCTLICLQPFLPFWATSG